MLTSSSGDLNSADCDKRSVKSASGIRIVSDGACSQQVLTADGPPLPYHRGWEVQMANSHPDAHTLEDVRAIMKQSGREARDKYCALNSLERYSGISLAEIPLDYDSIRRIFAGLHSHALGISARTLVNVRSRCNIAIKQVMTGHSPQNLRRLPLSSKWLEVRGRLSSMHETATLGGFIAWSSAVGLPPQEVDDAAFLQFAQYRSDNIRRDGKRYRHQRTKIWNDLASRAVDLNLRTVTVDRVVPRPRQLQWLDLPVEVRDHWSDYKHWGAGSNPFDPKARERALAPSSLKMQQYWLLSAIRALRESGFDVQSLRSLADVVKPAHVLAICETRYTLAGRKHTSFNFSVGKILWQIACWLEVPDEEKQRLRKILKGAKPVARKMTLKNKKIIPPFESEELRARLVDLPNQLFHEVRSSIESRRKRLSKLHAALAIGALTLFAIRLGNLRTLQFGEHIDLSQHYASLRIPEEEVKNGQALEFDIPPSFRVLLEEYRDNLYPDLTGHQVSRLFSNIDGTLKTPEAIRSLVRSYTTDYLGVTVNPHAFRHLAASLILDQDPGAHVVVQHLLGHSRLQTTATFYADVQTKRAVAII